MENKKFIDGNSAVAYGVMAAGAEVIAAYPITPQTKIVEKLSELIGDGEMAAEYIKVESEHSAMSACFGASSTGVRTFTATSSQGLAYMQEMLHYVSGARLPIVMAVVNRAFAPPWNITCDHQDTISARDTGWIQIYVETAQEALDLTLQAFRIAEDQSVLTPVMVCLDAFVLSHTDELVEIPAQEKVSCYLPKLQLSNFLDVNNPQTFAAGATADYAMEFRFAQQKFIENARQVIDKADAEFKEIFGRSYGGMLENYCCDGADAVLVALGSVSGTAKDVVDEMRSQGQRVGLIRIRSLRPFPVQEIRGLAANIRTLGVVDRDISYGYEGAVFTEIKSAVYGGSHVPRVYNFVAGLGGRDITKDHIREMFSFLLDPPSVQTSEVMYVGLRCSND